MAHRVLQSAGVLEEEAMRMHWGEIHFRRRGQAWLHHDLRSWKPPNERFKWKTFCGHRDCTTQSCEVLVHAVVVPIPFPLQKAPQWQPQTVMDRLNDCRRMLYLHGILSESQNEETKRKLRVWVKRGGRYP